MLFKDHWHPVKYPARTYPKKKLNDFANYHLWK